MKVIWIVFLASLVGIVKAQDPHFSQTYMQSMYLNPALTVNVSGWQTNFHYRNQWPEIKAYETYALGIQKQLTKIDGGIGLSVLNDNAGDGTIMTSEIGLNYAQRFQPIESLGFALGLNLGIRQKTVDWSKLTFSDMIDNRYGFVNTENEVVPMTSVSNFNLGMGLDVNVCDGNIGFGIANLLEPNEAFSLDGSSPLPRRFTSYASYPVYKNEVLQFSPVVKYLAQADFSSLLFGVASKYKFINVFIGGRNEDAVIAGLGVSLNRIKVQYSYDQTTSNLSNTSGGSHEFGVIFRFGSKEGYDDGSFVF